MMQLWILTAPFLASACLNPSTVDARRFFAADEDNKKAETSVFSDTGLMAMVCRHDQVLFMANLRESGEKRYYPLAQAAFPGAPCVMDCRGSV
jgi:hypothetical protein